MRKMESETESENHHFCKSEGRVPFLKNGRKMKMENEPKMAQKWLL
jgi:hypothetical protein